MKKSTIFLLSVLIFAILLVAVIMTIIYGETGRDVPDGDNLINITKQPEMDPRIDLTKPGCTGYSSQKILKEYGNWSKIIYYDRDNWNLIRP